MTQSPIADPWPAPRVTAPIEATVSLPGSKSLMNRALVLAAISDGPSVVRRALRSRDSSLMAGALTDWTIERVRNCGVLQDAKGAQISAAMAKVR